MTTGKNYLQEFIDKNFNLLQDRRKLTIMPPYRNYGKTIVGKIKKVIENKLKPK